MIEDLLSAVPDWLLTALPLAGGLCVGALLLFLLSLVFWTARDIAARSKDNLARIAAISLVLLLPVFGVIIYMLLRPRETLAEHYEREMVEELLAREISLAALQRRNRGAAGATSSRAAADESDA
jgi:heme/copper-type cytochrome/quinol oxidase subunit 2